MSQVFYLVRHAEAEKGSGGPDAERRLTPAGRAAFEALARSLGPSVRLAGILCSTLLRARETAKILSAATGAPVAVEPKLGAGQCTGSELLSLGQAAGGGVALVGHNPEVAEAVRLAAGGERKVPPGAVAAVEGGPPWRLSWLRAP
ncbi:MAG TPA: histidine phosphatase family protein [Anaeromyxobacteraceae bacterium]|nr:histidine phosphatase family protein [Anaeromyxobacteraceae bacterium]